MSAGASGDGPSVLVVDDEPPIRRLLKTSLTPQGFRVLEADTAAEGLRLVRALKPDVVILDLGLPDQDGISVMLKELVLHDHLPDYSITLEGDLVMFRNRESMKPRALVSFPLLDRETYNDVRSIAPGYDPYFLEHEWREWWVDSGCIELQHPDKAFIAFCKKR